MTTTDTDLDAVTKAVERLTSAARDHVPCPPVREFIGRDDVRLAYAVQAQLTDQRLASGRRAVGRKIGLTSPAVQQQLGVDQPDFGVLFDDMVCAENDVIDINRLLQPRIEAEIAFVLSNDITDPDVDARSIRDSIDHVVAALEIVDSRIAGWDISFADTVADNGSSGLYVLGAVHRRLEDFEPVTASMVMTMDGESVSSGSGSACLGDPLRALAWLARTSLTFGEPLRAGQVVLSGALGPMVGVRPGVLVNAEISGLGSVSARFSGDS